MTNKIFVGCCCLLFATALGAWAQKDKKLKEPKFGEVEAWEWEIKDFKGDTTVSAIILFDVGKSDFNRERIGGIITNTRHIRVKLLKPSSFDQFGNEVVSFYPVAENVIRLKAHTLHKDAAGKTVKYPVENKDIVSEKLMKISGSNVLKRFSYPNLQPGCIIELEYVISTYILDIPVWQFQSQVAPTLFSHYEVAMPSAIRIGEQFFGERRPDTSFSVSEGRIALGLNSFDVDRRHYLMRNVRPLPPIQNVYNPSNFICRVEIPVQDVRLDIPGEEKLVASWFREARELQKSKFYFNEDDKKEKDVEQLAAQLKQADTLSSLRKVHHFVNTEIRTVKLTDVESTSDLPSSIKESLKNKEATAQQKAMIAIRLLRQMGIDACPLFVRTRERGMIQFSNPTISQFDKILITAPLGNGDVVFDPNDKELPFGLVAEECYNYRAWLVTQDGSDFIEIPAIQGEDQSFNLNGQLGADGSIKGNFSVRSTGYAAIKARRVWKEKGSHHWIKHHLLDGETQVKSRNVTIDTTLAVDQPVITIGSLEKPDYASNVDGELYINPMIIDRMESTPFKEAERVFPVEFDTKWTKTYTLNLQLPEGYQVAEMPKNIRVVAPDKSIEFVRQTVVDGSRLTSQIRFINRKLVYSPQEYPALREVYERLVTAMADQIVLKPAK